MNEDKVTADHVRRRAYVYIRQSSMAQVRENTESLERQYELCRRAVELGWDAARVVVVDEDLGRSGADSSAREGFKSLVAAVGLGEAGIVLGIDRQVLARAGRGPQVDRSARCAPSAGGDMTAAQAATSPS
jgi:DNA invertase Pin-like site-specific DNA recombinase